MNQDVLDKLTDAYQEVTEKIKKSELGRNANKIGGSGLALLLSTGACDTTQNYHPETCISGAQSYNNSIENHDRGSQSLATEANDIDIGNMSTQDTIAAFFPTDTATQSEDDLKEIIENSESREELLERFKDETGQLPYCDEVAEEVYK